MRTVVTAALAVFLMLFGGGILTSLGAGIVMFGIIGLILLTKGEIKDE